MKTIHYAKFLFLLLLLACSKNSENTVIPDKKPAPPGGTKLSIRVEDGIDLRQTRAATLLDSVAMTESTPAIYVPTAHTSVAYFLEPGTSRVMAVVRTDAKKSELLVSPVTVTEGLFDLLPAYHDLTPAQRSAFELAAPKSSAYANFLAAITDRLKNKQPVYAIDADYLRVLRQLNTFILATYLNNGIGARVTGPDPSEIDRWLVAEESAVENQVYSYVDVTLEADTKTDSKTFLLQPRNYLLATEKQPLTQYADNYYFLHFTQATANARKENAAAGASKLVSMAIGLVFGDNLLGTGCLSDLNAALVSEVGSLLTANALNTTPEQDLSNLFNIAGNALQTAVTSKECLPVLLKKGILSKLNVWATIWRLGWTASDFIQLHNLRKALREPVDIGINMQLYNQKVLKGHTKASAVGTLKEKYSAGENIQVEAEINGNPAFTFNKANFKVKWVLKTTSGTVSPTEGVTGTDGRARAQWKMPLGTALGDMLLEAHFTDREGDELRGSPVKYTTKLLTVDTLAILRAKSWKLINGPHAISFGGFAACPAIKRPNYELVTSSLSFQAINNLTQVSESRAGICHLACGNYSIDLTTCTLLYLRPSNVSGANTMLVTVSKGRFITTNHNPDLPGPLPWILLGGQITSLTSDRLVIQNPLYYPGVELVYQGM